MTSLWLAAVLDGVFVPWLLLPLACCCGDCGRRRQNKAARRAAHRAGEAGGDEEEAARLAAEEAEFDRAKARGVGEGGGQRGWQAY